MAKVRGYKLAEELGIDRNDFVERAASVGIELKSPMAALEPEQVELLREKLGGVKARGDMDEKRVDSKRGATVIRRRKKAKPDVPEVEETVAEELPPVVALPEAEEPVSEDAADELDTPVEEEIAASAIEPAADAEPVGDADSDSGAEPQRRVAEPAAPSAPGGDRKGKQRKRVREVVNLREQENFGRQVTQRGGPQRRAPVVSRTVQSPRRRRRDAPARPVAAAVAPDPHKKQIQVEGEISVGELAKLLGTKAPQIQGKLMALGTMVAVTQVVDIETVRQVASEMGFEVQDVGFKETQFIEAAEPEVGTDANAVTRPPVITVMGHVDHGKTSLLDAIRKTKVTAGEAGGITQHIGAYQTRIGDAPLTFIDTPGHAAFTNMRARGAQATDLVVLVVAATDGVMPQTIEAIEHSRAAGCPIVVAINKCDLPEADPQRTRQRLMEHDLIPEEFGGDVVCCDVSAVSGEGISHLLEMLSLQAEVLELKADPARRAHGIVLEAELDKGRGPVATILVQTGTLRRGDVIVAGTDWGRVRIMEDDIGGKVKEAGPSFPVQVVGLSGVPESGATMDAVENERAAKQVIAHREEQQRSRPVAVRRKTLEELLSQGAEGGVKKLPVILKADVHGSAEAVRDALVKLSTDAVELDVISAGVGGITENDVAFASASSGVVVGFNVRPDPAARRAAEDHGVDIRTYRIIYELLDEVKAAMAGLLPPTVREKELGRAEVRDTFTIPRLGTIAGCYITEGMARRNGQCRLVRDGVLVYQGRIGSLRRFKDDVREVQTAFECGIGIDGYNDVKVGDVIEIFELEERPATL